MLLHGVAVGDPLFFQQTLDTEYLCVSGSLVVPCLDPVSTGRTQGILMVVRGWSHQPSRPRSSPQSWRGWQDACRKKAPHP